MSEIRFYQLTTTSLEQALPRVLEKVLARGQRAVVVAGSDERVEAIASALWTYDDRGFLPHGTAKDGFAADQPIWIATRAENPNGAQMLVLVDGVAPPDLAPWPSLCLFFDDADPAALAGTRDLWKRWKAEGHEVRYFRQGERGAWEQAG
ncbi:MAG: DNA polymerase III subunit chi [Alphaproteobacteria bacterium]